jgi:hypothetical protein
MSKSETRERREMTAIGLYFKGLSKENVNALRSRLNDIAASFGYTASRGPTVGEGNVAAMLEAIDSGEITLVLLPPEHQAMATDWLERQARILNETAPDFTTLGLAEALETIAQALRSAVERQQ